MRLAEMITDPKCDTCDLAFQITAIADALDPALMPT